MNHQCDEAIPDGVTKQTFFGFPFYNGRFVDALPVRLSEHGTHSSLDRHRATICMPYAGHNDNGNVSNVPREGESPCTANNGGIVIRTVKEHKEIHTVTKAN